MWGPHQTFQTEHVNKTIRAVRIPLLGPTHSKQRQNRTLQLGDKKTKILLLGRRGEARPAFPFRKKNRNCAPFLSSKTPKKSHFSFTDTREKTSKRTREGKKKREREREELRRFSFRAFQRFAD